MIKTFLISIFLATSASAVLADSTIIESKPITLTRDNVTYHYTVTEKSDGRYISGYVENTGDTFTLRVAHGRVTGDCGGTDVDFKVSDATSRVASAR